jgi:hypothetical protein
MDIVLDLYLWQAPKLIVCPRLWLFHLTSDGETPVLHI